MKDPKDQGTISVPLKEHKQRFDELALAANLKPAALARMILRQWMDGTLVSTLAKPGDLNKVSTR